MFSFEITFSLNTQTSALVFWRHEMHREFLSLKALRIWSDLPLGRLSSTFPRLIHTRLIIYFLYRSRYPYSFHEVILSHQVVLELKYSSSAKLVIATPSIGRAVLTRLAPRNCFLNRIGLCKDLVA